MTIVSVQAHYWYKRIIIIINIHFIVQVLIRLQPCGHSRWVLLLKMPDGKFFSWLLFNSLSKISQCIFNCMVYDNKVQGIRVLERELLPLFSKKTKDKQNKKPKQVKAWHSSVQTSKQKQTNRERCGYRFVSGSRDIFQLWSTHESVQLVYLIYKYFIFNMNTFFPCRKGKTQVIFTFIMCHFII